MKYILKMVLIFLATLSVDCTASGAGIPGFGSDNELDKYLKTQMRLVDECHAELRRTDETIPTELFYNKILTLYKHGVLLESTLKEVATRLFPKYTKISVEIYKLIANREEATADTMMSAVYGLARIWSYPEHRVITNPAITDICINMRTKFPKTAEFSTYYLGLMGFTPS